MLGDQAASTSICGHLSPTLEHPAVVAVPTQHLHRNARSSLLVNRLEDGGVLENVNLRQMAAQSHVKLKNDRFNPVRSGYLRQRLQLW